MEENEELRKYADTWIHIVTVLLAGEIIGLIFLYQSITIKSFEDTIITLFGVIMVSMTAMSLALFVIARDPRSKFSVSLAIDAGIIMFQVSLIVIVIGLYINDIVILGGNSVPATILFVFEIIAVSCFYPILYFSRKRTK